MLLYCCLLCRWRSALFSLPHKARGASACVRCFVVSPFLSINPRLFNTSLHRFTLLLCVCVSLAPLHTAASDLKCKCHGAV